MCRQVATAVLSITARAKRKEAEKKKDDKQPEKMDVDDDTKKDAGQEKDKKDGEKDEKEKVGSVGHSGSVIVDVSSLTVGRIQLCLI